MADLVINITASNVDALSTRLRDFAERFQGLEDQLSSAKLCPVGLLPWTPFSWRPFPVRWAYASEVDGRRRVCSLAEWSVAKDEIEEQGLPTAQLFIVPGYLDPTDA